MSSRLWSRVGVAVMCVALPLAAHARPDRTNAKTSGATPSTRATTILGSAWTANNAPIPQAHLRLRNVISGTIEATTIANDGGLFAFENVESGSYLVELVNEAGKIQVVGHIFTIAQGETVATFVRLGTKVPWFAGFFNSSVMAVSAAAASGGVAALAPVTRPVSANQ